MASELRVNTLKDASGNNSVATSTVAQGSAKSHVSATITSNTHTIQGSFNVASLTDDGAGKTDVVFTNNMNNDDYSANSTAALDGTAMFAHLGNKASITTSEYRNNTVNSSNSSTDYGVLCSVVHGDLA